MGKISELNTRTPITIPKELKSDLEKIAKRETRSFSNLVVSVLKEYRDKNYKDT